MSSCEAHSPTGATWCPEDPFWRAVYQRTCADWPREKLFCAGHGVEVARDWTPPFEEGNCGTCGAPMRLERLEVLE